MQKTKTHVGLWVRRRTKEEEEEEKDIRLMSLTQHSKAAESVYNERGCRWIA